MHSNFENSRCSSGILFIDVVMAPSMHPARPPPPPPSPILPTQESSLAHDLVDVMFTMQAPLMLGNVQGVGAV